MFVISLLDHKQYGGYFAFLLACVIVMFERLDHMHTRSTIAIAGVLLACGAFIYSENAGFFVLLVAFFLQSVKMHGLKSRALP